MWPPLSHMRKTGAQVEQLRGIELAYQQVCPRPAPRSLTSWAPLPLGVRTYKALASWDTLPGLRGPGCPLSMV